MVGMIEYSCPVCHNDSEYRDLCVECDGNGYFFGHSSMIPGTLPGTPESDSPSEPDEGVLVQIIGGVVTVNGKSVDCTVDDVVQVLEFAGVDFDVEEFSLDEADYINPFPGFEHDLY